MRAIVFPDRGPGLCSPWGTTTSQATCSPTAILVFVPHGEQPRPKRPLYTAVIFRWQTPTTPPWQVGRGAKNPTKTSGDPVTHADPAVSWGAGEKNHPNRATHPVPAVPGRWSPEKKSLGRSFAGVAVGGGVPPCFVSDFCAPSPGSDRGRRGFSPFGHGRHWILACARFLQTRFQPSPRNPP